MTRENECAAVAPTPTTNQPDGSATPRRRRCTASLTLDEVRNNAGQSIRISEPERETLARAMFERQAEHFEFAQGVADLAWKDGGIRSFWRAEADFVAETLGIG